MFGPDGAPREHSLPLHEAPGRLSHPPHGTSRVAICGIDVVRTDDETPGQETSSAAWRESRIGMI